MRADEAFGVLVRAVGFFIACYALSRALGAAHPAPGFKPSQYLAVYLPMAAFGLLILRRADSVVRFAYRQTDTDADDSSE